MFCELLSILYVALLTPVAMSIVLLPYFDDRYISLSQAGQLGQFLNFFVVSTIALSVGYGLTATRWLLWRSQTFDFQIVCQVCVILMTLMLVVLTACFY